MVEGGTEKAGAEPGSVFSFRKQGNPLRQTGARRVYSPSENDQSALLAKVKSNAYADLSSKAFLRGLVGVSI